MYNTPWIHKQRFTNSSCIIEFLLTISSSSLTLITRSHAIQSTSTSFTLLSHVRNLVICTINIIYRVFRKNCFFLPLEFSLFCHLSLVSTGLLLVAQKLSKLASQWVLLYTRIALRYICRRGMGCSTSRKSKNFPE